MRLRTLGSLQVEGCNFKRPKPLLLLSYLAIEGAKDRRYLSQVFWPQTSNPSHSLSKAIYRLKRGLEVFESSSAAEPFETEPLEPIQSDDQTLSTPIKVDVLDVLDCLEKDDLRGAIALYQGDFLASVNVPDVGEELEQWILQTRDYLSKRMQVAYLSLAQQQFAKEASTKSLDDNTQTALFYAEKAYKVLDSSLSSPDVIQALFEQLKLCKSPLAEKLLEEVQDFGIELNYDFVNKVGESASSQGESTFQDDLVTHADVRDVLSESAVNAQMTSGKANLKNTKKPLQSLFRIENQSFTKFIGRQKELSEVINLFSEENVRLLSLIGIGGSGKTRMAIELAENIAQDVGLATAIDEHYFVNLQSAKTPEAASFLFAETLGLEPDLNSDIVAQITEHIDQRSLLVILDGFEHVSGGANSLPELLYRCPNLYLIVTSRERLNVPEEWILHIRGLNYQLDTEDTTQSLKVTDPSEANFSSADLASWCEVDAIKFFAERAKQADVRFNLKENLDGVVELCTLVEGLPLALELAATWVRHMPCRQIVAEIKQSLDILYRDTQYADDHHTSIRAVFEHSWQLLNLREETIFASLTIFRQGFRREAAAVVADASILQLAAFLDKSLLTLDSSGRYHCHPLLKQFMAEKVTELKIDNSILASKHAGFYNNYLLELQMDFQIDIDKVVRFREDFENFGAAWYQTVEEENFQALQRLLPAFKVFLEHLHRYNDAIEPISKAVQKLYKCFEPKVAETHPALLDFRVSQAWAYGSSDYTQAEIFAKESIDLASNHDNDFAKGLALRLLGEIALEHKGDKVTARAYFDQALAIAQRTGNIELSARCWRYLAVIAVSNGDNEAALEFQRTALKHFENLGDKMGIADCRCEVGHLLVLAKRSDEAEVYLLDSLKLSREMDFKLGIVNSLCFLGDVAYDRKQFTKAEEYYNSSLELSEQIHDYYGVAGGYMDLATIAAAQQNIAKASQYFYKALDKAIALGVKPLQLSILTHVAILQLEHSSTNSVSGASNNNPNECATTVQDAFAMLNFIASQDETDQYDKDLIQEQFDKYKDKFDDVAKIENEEVSLVDWCAKTLQDLKDFEHKPTFEMVV